MVSQLAGSSTGADEVPRGYSYVMDDQLLPDLLQLRGSVVAAEATPRDKLMT